MQGPSPGATGPLFDVVWAENDSISWYVKMSCSDNSDIIALILSPPQPIAHKEGASAGLRVADVLLQVIDNERLVGYDRTRQVPHRDNAGEFAFVNYGEVPDMVLSHDREAVAGIRVRFIVITGLDMIS